MRFFATMFTSYAASSSCLVGLSFLSMNALIRAFQLGSSGTPVAAATVAALGNSCFSALMIVFFVAGFNCVPNLLYLDLLDFERLFLTSVPSNIIEGAVEDGGTLAVSLILLTVLRLLFA